MTEMPVKFQVATEGNKETNTIKLTMGGRSHGTFHSVDELLRYAARVKTGRIVLIPGVIPDARTLTVITGDIRKQANNLKKMGFK